MRYCGKISYSRADHRRQYGACALHAGHLRLQTHTHNTLYLLLFHCNNGCTNTPQYYAVRTLPDFVGLSTLIKATQCLLHFMHKCSTVSSASAHFTGKLGVTHSVTPRVLYYCCQPNCDSLIHPSSHSLTHSHEQPATPRPLSLVTSLRLQ